jgi:hypothetical protein
MLPVARILCHDWRNVTDLIDTSESRDFLKQLCSGTRATGRDPLFIEYQIISLIYVAYGHKILLQNIVKLLNTVLFITIRYLCQYKIKIFLNFLIIFFSAT